MAAASAKTKTVSTPPRWTTAIALHWTARTANVAEETRGEGGGLVLPLLTGLLTRSRCRPSIWRQRRASSLLWMTFSSWPRFRKRRASSRSEERRVGKECGDRVADQQ